MRKIFFRGLDEQGSVIVIAIMILALLTIIGVMSTGTSVTESYIVRNVALHKQNVYLTEAAAMEGLQKVMQLRYPDETNEELLESNAANPPKGLDGWKTALSNLDSSLDYPPVSVWLNSDSVWGSSDWYKTDNGRVLDSNMNLCIPDFAVSSSSNPSSVPNSVLSTRGELDKGYLRTALVGWQAASSGGQGSLKATGPVRRSGRILAEYMSPNYGMVRLEIGLEQIF